MENGCFYYGKRIERGLQNICDVYSVVPFPNVTERSGGLSWKKIAFYAWVRRLRKETCHTIPDPGRHHADNGICVNEVVKVEILPEEQQDPSDAKDNPVSLPTAGVPMVEIEANGILFRFTGTVDATLYEKTLPMTGGWL